MKIKESKRILPSEEEIAENERAYLETKEKLDHLTEEYNRLKPTLRCRYCGGKHYTSGYCTACYARIRNGQSLARNKIGEHKRRNNINLIYENGFSTADTMPVNDFLEIISHHSLDERSKDCMNMFFTENKTYAEIGEKYSVTKERVRKIINKAMWKCNLEWK